MVSEVLTNLPIPRYQLVDLQGRRILGNCLAEELSKYIGPSRLNKPAAGVQ